MANEGEKYTLNMAYEANITAVFRWRLESNARPILRVEMVQCQDNLILLR